MNCVYMTSRREKVFLNNPTKILTFDSGLFVNASVTE